MSHINIYMWCILSRSKCITVQLTLQLELSCIQSFSKRIPNNPAEMIIIIHAIDPENDHIIMLEPVLRCNILMEPSLWLLP